MIPQLTKQKFLPLFKKRMEIIIDNPQDSYRYIVRRVPIECQVLSAEPRLILSDGFHKVECEVSEGAVTNLKKYYPTTRFRDIANYIITLLEYEPYTYLDEYGNIRFRLHFYDFVLNSPEKQKAKEIIGSPKKLTSTDESILKTSYEASKHLKNYLCCTKNLNNLPPLEKILFNDLTNEPLSYPIEIKAVIQCPGNEPGNNERLLDYRALQLIEDQLTEKAGKLIMEQKHEILKQKQEGRELARILKCKKRPLNEELLEWADECEKDLEEKKANAITKGFITINPQNPSDSKKSSLSKKKQSEIKYTAKGFKGFLKWISRKNNSETNNVSEVISKDNSGAIKVDFAIPEKTKKAFDGWTTSVRDKKFKEVVKANSCMKSIFKKPKL